MSKVFSWFIFVLCVSAFVFNLSAQTTMEVAEMVVCTGVEDRVPVGADTMFLNTVEQLYCFTKVTGAAAEETISHLWYFVDKEMAKVDLTIGGDPWRTWSSKRITEEWSGNWRVDVVTASGEILKSMDFVIQEGAAESQAM
jgi:hypothetical protein